MLTPKALRSRLEEYFLMIPKILSIVTDPDPVLRARAAEIILSDWKREDLESLAADMTLTMKKSPGVGLAAPQIGKSIRLRSLPPCRLNRLQKTFSIHTSSHGKEPFLQFGWQVL